jgi:hypothetical protein
MLVLPTFADSFAQFSYQATIDGTVYTLQFIWSDRAASWYLYIQESDGTPIASGIRIVVDLPLTFRKQDARLPPGLILALDVSGNSQEIQQQSDLGDRVRLYYIPPDEAVVTPDTTGPRLVSIIPQ